MMTTYHMYILTILELFFFAIVEAIVTLIIAVGESLVQVILRSRRVISVQLEATWACTFGEPLGCKYDLRPL